MNNSIFVYEFLVVISILVLAVLGWIMVMSCRDAKEGVK